MSGLRAAAAALIAEAPEATVQIILRMLVDSLVPPATRVPKAAPVQRQAREKSAGNAKPVTAAKPDPAWDELRGSIRRAMTARGVDFADVGQAIGRSATAVRIDLTSRRPPRPALSSKFQLWLDQAPAVATPLPFPGSGTERRGNGHDAGGDYSSTAGHGSAAGNGSSLNATD